MIYDAGGDKKKLKGIWDRYLSKNNDVMNGFVHEKKRISEYQISSTYLSTTNAKGFAKEIKSMYNDYERSDISDMFDSFFDPIFGLNREIGYGHEPGYFGTKSSINHENVATEAFAEMYSAYLTGNQSLKKIQLHFPRAYDLFLEMLGVMK